MPYEETLTSPPRDLSDFVVKFRRPNSELTISDSRCTNSTKCLNLARDPVTDWISTDLSTHRRRSSYGSLVTNIVSESRESRLPKLLMPVIMLYVFSRSYANRLICFESPDTIEEKLLSFCSQTSDTIHGDPYSFKSFCLAS